MHVTILTDLSEEAINNMIDRIYVAARTCYSADTCAELYNLTDEKSIPDKVNLIKKVLASGHLSIIEHVNITFCVDGISRSASHQLVRHRLCTYSQQSQRYLCLEGKAFNYVTPPAIQNNENLTSIFSNFNIAFSLVASIKKSLFFTLALYVSMISCTISITSFLASSPKYFSP